MTKLLFTCSLFLISTIVFSQFTYTFNGNGNWSDSSNWSNNKVPPIVLDSGSQIIIDPLGKGECVLDTFQFIMNGAIITVKAEKKLRLSNNLVNNPDPNWTGLKFTSLDTLLMIPVFDTTLLPPLNQKTLPSSLTLSMPAEVDMPIIAFQGQKGSCTAFSTAFTTRSYYLHKDHCTSYEKVGGIDDSKLLSPAFIFNNREAFLAPCDRGGQTFPDALDIMKTKGVATLGKFPYDDRTCSKPNELIDKNAAIYKIKDYFRVNTRFLSTIKRILNSGNLIMAGISVDAGYALPKSGKYIWKERIGKNVGGHAIVICGWDDTLNAYRIANSWGRDWGFDGYGWIDYDYFRKLVGSASLIREDDAEDFGNWEMYMMLTSPNFFVDFVLTDSSIVKGNSINFTDATEPEPSSRLWSFPGGIPSGLSQESVTVKYDNPGTYKVTLRTKACSNYTQTKDTTITVLEKPILKGSTFSLITWRYGVPIPGMVDVGLLGNPVFQYYGRRTIFFNTDNTYEQKVYDKDDNPINGNTNSYFIGEYSADSIFTPGSIGSYGHQYPEGWGLKIPPGFLLNLGFFGANTLSLDGKYMYWTNGGDMIFRKD